VARYHGLAAASPAAKADFGYAADRRPDTIPPHCPPIAPNAATRATWGEPPTAQRPRTIALVAWRPFVKGALRGFATVELPIGLEIADCPVLVSNGKAWASLPSKPVLDRDGRQKTDANGRPAYTAILEWRAQELRDRFSDAVVEAIRRLHPEALDDGAEP
jgi:hypothetical protein